MTAEEPGAARRSAGLVRAAVAKVVPGWGRLGGLLSAAGAAGGGSGRAERRSLGGKPSRAQLREHQERVTREWEVLRDRLTEVAGGRIADVGDLLRDTRLDFVPDRAERAATRDYEWAMEAFQAAGKLLDEAADLPDLAAAIVLADRAVERFAAAHARHVGERPAAPVTRCFYNPLHGRAERDHRAGRSGGRRSQGRISQREAAARRRPACAECRMAILAGQTPDVLPALTEVTVGRHHTAKVFVPYYAVPQARSLWSATTCGATDDDAPARVLRGEHRSRATGTPRPAGT